MTDPVNRLIATTAYEARLSLIILENLMKRSSTLKVFSDKEIEEMRQLAIQEVKKLHPDINFS